MGDDRRILGAEGELRAAHYLEAQGYRITAHNVRAGGVEIDLIAERGGTVVFVEVKTRRSRRFGAPEEAVNARNRARLLRGAAAWLRQQPRSYRSYRPYRLIRFDVISCECRRAPDGRETDWQIRHFEGAFDAGS